MDNSYFTPAQIAENCIEIGRKKTSLTPFKQFLLGILAGAFIAFAAEGSNTAIHTISSVGIGKALAGALFSTGLMFVLIAGGELFTGNCLIVIACLSKKASWSSMFKNWFFVYLGNLVGSVIVVYCIFYSGQFNFSSGLLGGFSIKVAAYKTSLPFGNAFFMGILCNWLVCLAVWMSYGAKDIASKILAIFFPIWLFITSGFEHSIANMYYIPVGILAKGNSKFLESAISLGVTPEALDNLNISSFFIKNLLPVTLGNIIGGAIFVGVAYWLIYLKSFNVKTSN